VTAAPTPSSQRSRVVGYLFALGAGATWGTTGPLSTGLYGLMPATSIGFWRVLIGTVALAIWGVVFRRDLFRADRRSWLIVGLGGGALVALFEIAYQFAIAGVGVAGAAALLYTAPVMVAVLARVVLKEALTPTRIALAIVVMIGVALTVTGGSNAGAEAARMGVTAGVAGGLLSALSYALTSLMGRWAAPRYGVVKVLFLEAVGGVILIWMTLAIWGKAPTVPPSATAWRGLLGLAAGSVIFANLLFFGAMKRIEAAPASVAATIEPVVGALLALLLFSQRLTTLGWLGLLMVVAGVATGYVLEGLKQQLDADTEEAGRPV
jgi:DME family drug/metabolite transporter